jgi:putative ABC transport system substrate-binding protein
MRRREVIAGLGGIAAAWPFAARAQQRVRRVGMLMGLAGVEELAAIATFRESLAKLGWFEGRNLRLDVRFGAANPDITRAYAAELVGLGPDAILVLGGGALLAVREETQTIPIVAIGAGDAFATIGNHIANPEGNVTGVSNLFDTFGGKWLELLKEAVPQVEKVAFIDVVSGSGRGSLGTLFFPSISDAAHALGVEATKISYSNAVDFVHSIDSFAKAPNVGLIIPPAAFAPYRGTILILAAQHRLPTVVGNLPRIGALICYGPNDAELFRRGATIVQHIFRGDKVSEVPFEYPTRFELTVNVKTAKVLGLAVPPALLLRADEIIE